MKKENIKIKYRLLNDKELSELKEEFTQFLIIQGIHNDEWTEINKNDPKKALQIVAVFSDTVLEKSYSKVKYLEYKSKSFFSVFEIGDHSSKVLKISSTTESINLAEKNNIEQNILSNNIKIQRGEKKHNKERGLEIHQLIFQGCSFSSEETWAHINKLINHHID